MKKKTNTRDEYLTVFLKGHNPVAFKNLQDFLFSMNLRFKDGLQQYRADVTPLTVRVVEFLGKRNKELMISDLDRDMIGDSAIYPADKDYIRMWIQHAKAHNHIS